MLGNLHVRFGVGVGVQIPGLHHEIRACCRLAALLDVPLVEAAQNVVPVARTAAESIERLRAWAHGRCLSADEPGLFRRDQPAEQKPGRKISRGDASQN